MISGRAKPNVLWYLGFPVIAITVPLAAPEGVQVKTTKSGRSRRVPVADRVLPLVRAMAAGRQADAPLFVTATGHETMNTLPYELLEVAT